MGLFEHWPYVNFHDLNLDWIIKEIPKVFASRDEAQASADASAESAAASQLSADAALASQEAAHQSELNAAQSEENAAGSAQDAADTVENTQNQINLLQSRVDNIIPDGTQTAGNTELIDARVGANTVTYDSAGNAVRGQFTDVNNSVESLLSNSETDIYVHWEQGTISATDGTEIQSSTKIRTQYIAVNDFTHIEFHNISGCKFRTVWLDSSNNVVRELAYNNERTNDIVKYGDLERYNIETVRIVLGNVDDSEITPEDGALFKLTGYSETNTEHAAIDTTLKNNYVYGNIDYNQIPLTEISFNVGDINSGEPTNGYRPYTEQINVENDMIIRCSDYDIFTALYVNDEYTGRINWSKEVYIPYSENKKIRLLFDTTGHPNNLTSPQIDDVIKADLYIGVKKQKDYIKESVNNVITNMDDQNGNALNIAFITDLHVKAFVDMDLNEVSIWNRNSNGLEEVDKNRNIDFLLLGGDYLWNNQSTTLVRAQGAYKLLQNVFYRFKDKAFALKGNHDDNSLANNAAYLVNDSMRYGYLGQQYTNKVIIHYGDAQKSYGYIDFMRQNIRAVFINTSDIPDQFGAQNTTGVSNNQLNFIADALKIEKPGWSVIFFSHYLLVNNQTMNPSDGANGYLTPAHGGNALWGMIQAYKNKQTFTITSTLQNYEYSVAVDYTGNQSDEVIACINGHTHRDLSALESNILLISTTAAGFGQSAYDSEGNPITFTINTKNETAFDIFSVNRISRTITASRYGAGQNRSWSF